MTITQTQPDYATCPGAILLDVLAQHSMTQVQLAKRLGVTKKTVGEIVKGKAPITCSTASGLERILGVPASLWLNAENIYQMRRRRIKENLSQYKEVLRHKAIRELVLRKIIPEYNSPEEGIEHVLKFFHQGSVESLCEHWKMTPATLRHSVTTEGDKIALSVWFQIGFNKAITESCSEYDKTAFKNALNDIREQTVKRPSEFVPKMTKLCADAGVVFLIIPEIEGAAVNGASGWVSPKKAYIMLNLRGKRNDIFWFTFFHEAAHILKGHKVDHFASLTEKTSDEDSADKFASSILLPQRDKKTLCQLKSKEAIIRYSQKQGVHPGIVVGHLQNAKLIPYNRFNNLKEKFVWKSSIE